MQKTTRLVATIRRLIPRALFTPCLMLALTCSLPLASAQTPAESRPEVQATEKPGETWGEATPPKDYVRSKAPGQSEDAYNWVQMGYAALVMLAMVGLMVWLVRRSKRVD